MEKSVLVLNANFEPINVCGFKRAIGLMITEKATMILDGRGIIRTTNASYPIPSVIRLQKMALRPHPKTNLSRHEIFRRDRFTCQYCGKKTLFLTVDHVLPKHLGGKHTWKNLVAACPPCNHRKGGRTLFESGMKLLRHPQEPPQAASYIFARYLNENYEWQTFLEGW
ncbi:MAG: HNH endonuclease [Chloroflexi bacterium]|nr:HNH endonuclease [Chloroflexota bacterium]